MLDTHTSPHKRSRTQLAKALAKSPTGRRLANVLKMKMDGMSHAEIAATYGISRQAIDQQVQGIWRLLDPENLEAYRTQRVAVLEGLEAEILSSMCKNDKLEKASGNNLAYMLTQVHQARRLEAGESTQNVALHSIVEQLEREERDRRSRRDAQPAEPQDVVIEQDPSDA